MLNWAKRLQSGEGGIDFVRIFTGDQVRVVVNLAKRPQSGEGGLDFDRIFTGHQVRVVLACKGVGGRMYINME